MKLKVMRFIYTMNFEDEFTQDWDEVIITSSDSLNNNLKSKSSFGRLLINARQQARITKHDLSQSLNIKLSLLTDYENDKLLPEKKIISKMNKILNAKLPYKNVNL